MAATPGPELDGSRVIAQARAVARRRQRADLVTVDVFGTYSRLAVWTTALAAAQAALEPGETLGRAVSVRQVQRPRRNFLPEWTATWRIVR